MTEKSQPSSHKKTTNDKTKNSSKIKQWPYYIKSIWFLIVRFFKSCKKHSEPIRNWLIVLFTGILAFYTYRLFDTAVRQTEIAEKIEAATIDILGSNITQIQNRNMVDIVVVAEIANGSQKTFAEDIEIQTRFDLLKEDFSDMKIIYKKPIKEFQLLSGFGSIYLRDTVTVSRDFFYSQALEAFFHMRFRYNNGFGKRIITNFGFSYDAKDATSEPEICKHTYKENSN